MKIKKYNIVTVDTKKCCSDIPLKHYQTDIKSQKLEQVFLENNIDCVIHLAAQVSVNNSINNPLYDAGENIIGTLNLINLCKKYKVKKILAASTAAIYGDSQSLPLNENAVPNPLSPYAVSKLAMENYIKISGIDYIIFRYSNVYGDGLLRDGGGAGVVTKFVNGMLHNEKIIIYGDGSQTRDFICIDNVVEANLRVLETNIKNEIFNCSSGIETPINLLFEELSKITGYNQNPVYMSAQIGSINRNVLDNSKIKKFYYPDIDLKTGLSKLVKNYMEIKI